MASPSRSCPGRLLAKARPITRQQREILRSYILRRRKLVHEDQSKGSSIGEEYPRRTINRALETSLSGDDVKSTKPCTAPGVSEQGELLSHIKTQISSLQEKLVSLREEKHRLFQQLKNVLNEEDKERDKDQRHGDCLQMTVPGDSFIGDSIGGYVSRHLTTALESSYSHKQSQRGPLLPTPELSQFSRP